MNIDQAIDEYIKLSSVQVITEAVGGESLNKVKQQKKDFFKLVSESMTNMIEEDASDILRAALLFSEMSLFKIDPMAAYLSYYYGTLSLQLRTVPEYSKIDVRRFRLFSLFHNLDSFDRLIGFAQSPMMGYEGHLTLEQFFDFLIMSDAYRVWDSDDENTMLRSIKRLVNQHKENHPQFTRTQIIEEGKNAHKALFTAVKYVLNKI